MSRTLQKIQGLLSTAKEIEVVTEGYTKFRGLDLMDEDDLAEFIESLELHVQGTGVEDIYTEGVMKIYVATLQVYCTDLEELKEVL